MGTVWASGRSLGFQDHFALFQVVLELNSSQQKLFRTFRPASQMRGLVEAMTTHTTISYPTSAGQVRHRASILVVS
jgi:hypothetical protein